MTNDFITLACPTCGGKLNFSPNTTSLICPNCGNEHLVRHDMANITLESYARCPVCGRNDEVKKVSAILANQISGTQSSVLAMKLQPPTLPEPQKPSSILRYVVLFFGVICLIDVFVIIFEYPGLNGLIGMLQYLIPGALLMWWYVNLNNKYKKEVIIYNQKKTIREQEYSKLPKAMERWNKLYYCFRDDCIFIPSEKTYAEVGSIKEYVFRIA